MDKYDKSSKERAQDYLKKEILEDINKRITHLTNSRLLEIQMPSITEEDYQRRQRESKRAEDLGAICTSK